MSSLVQVLFLKNQVSLKTVLIDPIQQPTQVIVMNHGRSAFAHDDIVYSMFRMAPMIITTLDENTLTL